MTNEYKRVRPWSKVKVSIEDLIKRELHNLDVQASIINKLFNEPKDHDNENHKTNTTSK